MKHLKMSKTIVVSLLLCTLFSACTELEEEKPSGTEGQVCFKSSVFGFSRATATAFEIKDSISVFAFKNESDLWSEGNAPSFSNIKYVYNGTVFAADKEIIHYPQNTPLAFLATYPTIASSTATFSFQVKEDQSLSGNYTKSDLMTAFAASTTEAVPNLIFNHRLSSVVVNLTFEQVPPGTTRLGFTSVLDVKADISAGTFAKGEGNVLTIWAADNGANSYKAVLPPQTVASGKEFIVIKTTEGNSYTYTLPADVALNSGKQRTFDLTVTAAGKVIATTEKETEIGGQLIVRPSNGGGDVTFAIIDEAQSSFGVILDSCFFYENNSGNLYNDEIANEFKIRVDHYSSEKTKYEATEFSISRYVTQSYGGADFTLKNNLTDHITAEILNEDMVVRLNLSGNGTLEYDGPATIVSGDFVLPLMYEGITKKKIQQISEIDFPSMPFELPFPVDEAMIITKSKLCTKGGALYYEEGSLALYEEMKQKIEVSGFTLGSESTKPDGSKEGTWGKANKIINVGFSVSGIRIIPKNDVWYHFMITAIETSSPVTRSAAAPLLHMNKIEKPRNKQ